MAGDGSCCNMNGLERRYHSLRAHLDELGFRQPLAIECVPLVEALFKDLLHTTSSLENYKKQAQELDEQVRVLNKGVQPFRTDNERLVRQITELNKQITKIKEEAETSVGDAKARCRKLEHENADLQFLVSQHLSRIRTLEVESTEKSKKLLSLQSAPSISIGKKKSGLNSQTKVEILSSIGPSKKQPPGRPWLDVFSGALTQTEDPFVVNMVDRSQAELRAARYEMKLLREEKEKLSETISSLKQQVRDRDLDIAKLHTQVENNRCHPSARDPEIMKDDYTIANLRATIVSLEDSNNNLRTQLQDALRKQHEAMMRAVHLAERNQVLTNEIRNVDNVAMRVEDSCNHTVKETSQRIIELQEQLSHYQKMVADLERTGVEARCNAQNLSIDLEKLRLENKHLLETQQFRNTQSHLQTDRVEMSRQQHIEKELTKEIENLVAAVTYQKQKISELEEKVALTTAENQAASSAPVSGTGSGSATSKGSSNSSSGRSGVATKKQSTAKKTVTHAPSSKNPSGDNGKARSSNRSAGIQTDMKRIDSKEVQVNLRHEPPERETAQSYSGDRGDRYKETEYRKEKRRDFKSKREEEVEEYTSERYTEEGQERWSQESRKDQERRARDKSRKQDDHGSDRSQPTQKVDRGSQSEEVGPSKSNASQNNNNINHHHHPCMDGAGDGPWNVKSPPDLCPIIKTLEAERNFFEKEYLRIREYLDNLPEKLGSTDLLWKLREAHAELDLLRAENHRLSKEVADLSAVYKCEAADSRSHSDANRALAEKYTKVQQRLGEKERELLLVCEENHSLLTERDSLRLLAQRESHECERLSNDIHSLQLEIDILRAKKSADVEKDRLIEENRSLQLEIGVLRGQKEGEKTLDRERERERERLAEENRRLRETIETLKTSTMFNSSEKMCYDQPQQSVMAVVDALHSTQKRVWELESDGRDASRTFDREVLELRSQLSARTKQLDAATLQSEAARTRLTELQNSLAQANANHMKMKVLLEETERSLEQTQNDLSRLQTDSVHQQERIQKLEYDRAALEKEVNSLRSEVQRLHGSINDLENEKDELIRTADERAEQVQMLSEDIRQRDNRIKQLEKAIHDLQYAAE